MLTKPLDMYAHDNAASSVFLGAKAQENKAHISSMLIKNPFHMKGSRHTTKVVGFLFQRKKQDVSHMNEKPSLKKNNEKAHTSSFQSKAHASVSKNASTESKPLVSTELFAEDIYSIVGKMYQLYYEKRAESKSSFHHEYCTSNVAGSFASKKASGACIGDDSCGNQ
jgi:hypothetical protein